VKATVDIQHAEATVSSASYNSQLKATFVIRFKE